jgi:hypothetical protein
LSILRDSNRVFLTTPFLALEVVPKAAFNRQELELSFYERYMASATTYRGLRSAFQLGIAYTESTVSPSSALKYAQSGWWNTTALTLASGSQPHANESDARVGCTREIRRIVKVFGSPPWTRFELLQHKGIQLELAKRLPTRSLPLESARPSRLGSRRGHFSKLPSAPNT